MSEWVEKANEPERPIEIKGEVMFRCHTETAATKHTPEVKATDTVTTRALITSASCPHYALRRAAAG